LETARKWIRRADRLVDFLVYILIILMLLYAGYALWDNYTVYRGTEVDSRILRYKPTVSDPSLSDLQAVNPDVVAWLTVDGTNIDYPVLQGRDNAYYLNRSCYKEYFLGGSIFLDYRNNRNFTDFYSILYGHHMDGGAMFGDIRSFEDRAVFDRHQTGTLIVPGTSYDLEIFAVMHEDAYVSPMFELAEDRAEYAERLAYIKKNAVQYRDLGVGPDDRIIGMSTCSSATTNGRTILLARLTEHKAAEGEKEK
jgi:sortase B